MIRSKAAARRGGKVGLGKAEQVGMNSWCCWGECCGAWQVDWQEHGGAGGNEELPAWASFVVPGWLLLEGPYGCCACSHAGAALRLPACSSAGALAPIPGSAHPFLPRPPVAAPSAAVQEVLGLLWQEREDGHH